jgi:hypothetical protein
MAGLTAAAARASITAIERAVLSLAEYRIVIVYYSPVVVLDPFHKRTGARQEAPEHPIGDFGDNYRQSGNN